MAKVINWENQARILQMAFDQKEKDLKAKNEQIERLIKVRERLVNRIKSASFGLDDECEKYNKGLCDLCYQAGEIPTAKCPREKDATKPPQTDAKGSDDESPSKYKVDFYDMIDGWIHYHDKNYEFHDLDRAKQFCDEKNLALDLQNRSAGEHWGVIDLDRGIEVYHNPNPNKPKPTPKKVE